MKNGTKKGKKRKGNGSDSIDVRKTIQEIDEELDNGYYQMHWLRSSFTIHPGGGLVDLIFEDEYGVTFGIVLSKDDCEILHKRLKRMSKMLLE